jgi:hypothetical protein
MTATAAMAGMALEAIDRSPLYILRLLSVGIREVARLTTLLEMPVSVVDYEVEGYAHIKMKAYDFHSA